MYLFDQVFPPSLTVQDPRRLILHGLSTRVPTARGGLFVLFCNQFSFLPTVVSDQKLIVGLGLPVTIGNHIPRRLILRGLFTPVFTARGDIN